MPEEAKTARTQVFLLWGLWWSWELVRATGCCILSTGLGVTQWTQREARPSRGSGMDPGPWEGCLLS